FRTFAEKFQGHRSHSGDQLGFVGGMDVAAAALPDERFHMVAGYVEIATMFDQFRPEVAHGGVLAGIVSDRHDDGASHLKATAGEGERLTVVARRTSENTGRLFVLAECSDEVHTAADLERADGLVVLQLEQVTKAE